MFKNDSDVKHLWSKPKGDMNLAYWIGGVESSGDGA